MLRNTNEIKFNKSNLTCSLEVLAFQPANFCPNRFSISKPPFVLFFSNLEQPKYVQTEVEGFITEFVQFIFYPYYKFL